jgi:undecaprenyl-diphosphatase
MKKRPLYFFAIIFLLGFLFFTLLVHFDLFTTIDLFITESLQKLIPQSVDIPFSLFSLFGSLEIVLLIILILWAVNKKLNYFNVLFFLGLFHVFEFIGKVFVNHPGPSSRFYRYDLPFLFPSSSVSTGFSFPSGHMGRTIFLSTILIFLIYYAKRFSKFQKQIFYILIISFDLIMFISRIYLGEHWFSDILGATILGASFALLAVSFSLKHQLPQK